MHNWAGNHRFQATQVHRPTSVDELCGLLKAGDNLRAIGSRHSFTDVNDANAIIDGSELPEVFAVDHDAMTVTVSSAMTYTRCAALLSPHRLALHNLASLPHITVAGATATATHGSGSGNGNLATAVRAIEIATSTGELISLARGDDDFDGAVVSLGALGVATLLTVAVQPSFDLAQTVYEGLPWSTLTDSFDDVFAAGYSVSAFTRYANDSVETIWVKQDSADAACDDFFGASPAQVAHHPIPGHDGAGCTRQFGVAGPWHERLPHFEADAIPSIGAEIQSEFFVSIEHAADAIEALREAYGDLDDAMYVSEIRTVAADDLWMSPQCGQSTVAFHFTWKPDQAAAAHAAATVATALAPFAPRPHWGKVFPWSMLTAQTYERAGDFIALAERLDPRGAFRNEWFERLVSAIAAG